MPVAVCVRRLSAHVQWTRLETPLCLFALHAIAFPDSFCILGTLR